MYVSLGGAREMNEPKGIAQRGNGALEVLYCQPCSVGAACDVSRNLAHRAFSFGKVSIIVGMFSSG